LVVSKIRKSQESELLIFGKNAYFTDFRNSSAMLYWTKEKNALFMVKNP
jgi:hypothetical protein